MRVWSAILLSIVFAHRLAGESPPSQIVSEFQHRLESNGSVTFEAWNGKPECFDCDTHLIFLLDGRVNMLESGYVATTYHGKYHISNDGKIIATFRASEGRGPKWC
jgi:hypothetical protein